MLNEQEIKDELEKAKTEYSSEKHDKPTDDNLTIVIDTLRWVLGETEQSLLEDLLL